MSTKSVSEFLRMLGEDGEFKNQCRDALASEGPDAVVKLAAKRGLEFTAEEFVGGTGDGEELDDEALDAVAGGISQGNRMPMEPRVVKGAFARVLMPGRGGRANFDVEDEQTTMP